jgi:hypothetical protein
MLEPLKQFAAKFGAAVVLIGHRTKAGGRSRLMRVKGSGSLVALARAVFSVERVGDRIAFIPEKTNLGRPRPALAYRSESRLDQGIETAVIVWESSPIPEHELSKATSPNKDGAQLDAAKDFLRLMLADGRVPSKALEKEASGAGISTGTLRRAANDLCVKRIRSGGFAGQGTWFCELPQEPSSPPKVLNAP